jgi:small-conductance mechanosensitive channel
MITLDTVIYNEIVVGDLIIFVVWVFGALILAKILAIYMKKSFSDRISKPELDKLIKVIQVIIVLIAIYFGFPRIEVNLSEIILIGGTASLVIAFASQKLVSNFGSGLFLLIERPVKIGDNISIGDVSGNVDEIRILSTIIRTYEGIYVRVPNEKIFTSDITNYVANSARRFEYVIGISYRDDAGEAIRIISDLLKKHPYVLTHPEPSLFVSELADSSVNITINIWAPSATWWSVKTEMLWKIKAALEENGIVIPFPQRVITFAGENLPGSRDAARKTDL